MQIEIDFDVFKALTARRRTESHTFNDVIREMLDIDHGQTVHDDPPLWQAASRIVNSLVIAQGPTKGILLRGVFLPNGTVLRATYKGALFEAKVVDGVWVAEDGASFKSPSAAATAITQTNVNGWRFWEAKRPSDTEWRRLDRMH